MYYSMFNAIDDCENVHSQSRRMIMVSPEPDFWIHAVCIHRSAMSMTYDIDSSPIIPVSWSSEDTSGDSDER